MSKGWTKGDVPSPEQLKLGIYCTDTDHTSATHLLISAGHLHFIRQKTLCATTKDWSLFFPLLSTTYKNNNGRRKVRRNCDFHQLERRHTSTIVLHKSVKSWQDRVIPTTETGSGIFHHEKIHWEPGPEQTPERSSRIICHHLCWASPGLEVAGRSQLERRTSSE